MADIVKKNDFEEAADFIMITAPAPKFNGERNHRTSALKFKKGKVRTGPKTGVELRFYKKNKWQELSQEARDECMDIRKNEKKRRFNDDGKEDNNKKKIAALEAKIKDQEIKISSLSTTSENNLPPPPSGNPLQPPTRFTQRGGSRS